MKNLIEELKVVPPIGWIFICSLVAICIWGLLNYNYQIWGA